MRNNLKETSIPPTHGQLSAWHAGCRLDILIVDDEVGLALNLQDILIREGYETVVAHDGETALALCRDKAFDLAFVDIKLPGMSGIELVDKLADLSPETACIMITGDASLGTTVAAARHTSVVACQTKPLNMDRLLSLVKQMSERKQAEQALPESERRSVCSPISPRRRVLKRRWYAMPKAACKECNGLRERILLSPQSQPQERGRMRDE